MPYKHCAASFRNIAGVKYEQWSDMEQDFPEQIEALKKDGRKYRVLKISDGGRRLFREVRDGDR